MKEKEDLRIRKTKANLLKSISVLLKKKPFEKITITDICRQSKINRSTFYEHYIEKEDLLKDLIKESMKDLETHLVLPKPSTSIKENYLQIMKIVHNYLEENKEGIASFPNSEDVFLEIKKIVIEKYTEILEKNCKSTKLDFQEISIFYVSGGIALMKESKEENPSEILTKLKKLIPE